MTPVGVASLLPERARLQRRLEQAAIDHFSQLGYQEVIPPLVEYLDVVAPALGAKLADSAYKFADRSTGRMMVLRPDVTPQIARMVAQLLADEPGPHRFCYRATVFRHEEEHAGREREVVQIGVELIGPDDAAADSEVVVLALSTLEKIGITGCRVSIGHPGIFEGVLARTGASESAVRDLREALARRDRAELQALARAAKLPRQAAAQLESLLDSIGQREVLTQARQRMRDVAGGKAAAALRRVSDIYDRINAAGYGAALLVDLGEVRGFDYYTGMVFDLFADGIGYEIGGGGRYDQLIGRFGVDRPSTGFALHASPLLQLLAQREMGWGADGTDGGRRPRGNRTGHAGHDGRKKRSGRGR